MPKENKQSLNRPKSKAVYFLAASKALLTKCFMSIASFPRYHTAASCIAQVCIWKQEWPADYTESVGVARAGC